MATFDFSLTLLESRLVFALEVFRGRRCVLVVLCDFFRCILITFFTLLQCKNVHFHIALCLYREKCGIISHDLHSRCVNVWQTANYFMNKWRDCDRNQNHYSILQIRFQNIYNLNTRINRRLLNSNTFIVN